MRTQYLSYGALLFAIILIGILVRLPGVQWLVDAAPFRGYSFHPDDYRFIKEIGDFRESRPWRGYVRGMATHLYVVTKTLEKTVGVQLNPAILIRLISLFYGIATVVLVTFLVRFWSYSPRIALTTALLLALSPLHVINSHFGTSDVSATFYFYLALFLGWLYMRSKVHLLFIAFAAAVGACIAFKFFLALLLPFALLIWLGERDRILERAISGTLVVIASFTLFNFSNYTPWDFSRLMQMLMFDNIWVPGGETPAGNIILFGWEMMSALGLGTWSVLMVGIFFLLLRLLERVKTSLTRDGWKKSVETLLNAPQIVLWSAFLAHAFLIITPQLHVIRHLVAFLPLACFVAAYGFWELGRRLHLSKVALLFALTLLTVYQTYTVANVEKIFTRDIRNEMAAWIKDNVSSGESVATYPLSYAWVAGVQEVQDLEDKMLDSASTEPGYFATCDLGYARYLANSNAKEVFHPHGGQARLDFYHDLFADRLDFEPVLDLSRRAYSPEQWLRDKGILRPLDTFTPGRCLIFRRKDID